MPGRAFSLAKDSNMSVNRTGIHTLYAASTYTTALAVPSVTASLPTGANGTAAIPSPAIEMAQFPAVRFSFGGTATDNNTVNYQIIGWTTGNNVYVPKVLAAGVLTLSATTMAVAGLDTAATLLVDTITETMGLGGVVARSPGNDRMADITVWPGNCQYVTVECDCGTSATASCYFEMLDEAASAGNVGLLNSSPVEWRGNLIVSQASTGPTIGTTTSLALGANANRVYASFVNDADEDIYLAFGTNAVMNTGIMLEAGRGSYEITKANLFKGQVNAICTSGGKILCVTEGV